MIKTLAENLNPAPRQYPQANKKRYPTITAKARLKEGTSLRVPLSKDKRGAAEKVRVESKKLTLVNLYSNCD